MVLAARPSVGGSRQWGESHLGAGPPSSRGEVGQGGGGHSAPLQDEEAGLEWLVGVVPEEGRGL